MHKPSIVYQLIIHLSRHKHKHMYTGCIEETTTDEHKFKRLRLKMFVFMGIVQ